MFSKILICVSSVVAATALAAAIQEQEPPADKKYDVEPVLVRKVSPEYPPEAKDAGVEGQVYLQVRIETDGSTSYVRTLKSLSHGCTEAAIQAAVQWTWKPALKDGEPVATDGIVTLDFEIEDEDLRS